MTKGNPRGIFDDHERLRRKAERKAKVRAERKADSQLMEDVDTRLKTLIDKNRQVTKSYIVRAQALKDDRDKLSMAVKDS